MDRLTSIALQVGDWRIDPQLGQMSRGTETVRLEARTLRLLMYLANRAGETVGIEELLDQVWSGVVVTQDSVYQAITALRRLLGDDAKQPTYIVTVPRLGYRLIAPVRAAVEEPALAIPSPALPARPRATRRIVLRVRRSRPGGHRYLLLACQRDAGREIRGRAALPRSHEPGDGRGVFRRRAHRGAHRSPEQRSRLQGARRQRFVLLQGQVVAAVAHRAGAAASSIYSREACGSRATSCASRRGSRAPPMAMSCGPRVMSGRRRTGSQIQDEIARKVTAALRESVQ